MSPKLAARWASLAAVLLVASAAIAGDASGDTPPRDVYACHLDGRSTTWTYVGGFPSQGDYRFAGEVKCVHFDVNASSDGADDSGPRLTGTFEFGGDHSQLLGLPACIMQLDGFHVQPIDYGRITLADDGEGPLVFRHEMGVAGGQGDFEFHDDGDPANGVVDGYGTVNLVPTDALEGSPGTQSGCLTRDAPGFFLKADVVAGVFRTGPDQAPSNTAPPTISGTAREGEVLTAHNGTWSGSEPIVYDYQWRRCDQLGANCTPIAGAKANRYVVQRGDVGSTIRVEVTGTNTVGSSPRATSNPTAKVEPKFTPPTNISRPTISGTARTGETLTADKGVWSGTEPIAYDYQWLRCNDAGTCQEIAGAKGDRYHVQYPFDLGARIRVKVTATNAGGSSDAQSDPTAPVEYFARPSNTARPAISGIAREGEVLTAYKGTWSGSEPIAYGYQWQRCDQAEPPNCNRIDGAKADRYVLTRDDVGARIRVRVEATNVAGTSDPAYSDPTATVQPVAAPSNTSPPTISGTASVGEVLVADPGTWSGSRPMAFEYQWERCSQLDPNDCSPIAGARGDRYLVQFPIDLGTRIRVKVTARNAFGAAPKESAATPPVGFFARPTNTRPPRVSGIPKIGEPLIAGKGEWSGTAPVVYDLRWQRCDQNGAGCTDIPGATSERYVLSELDAGSRIRVTVGATNLGGSELASSEPTDVVEGLPRPANTALPTISGRATVGEVLTADRGNWSGSDLIAYDYQWLRCDAAGEACANILGAKAERYVVGSGDVGSTIRVLVTVTNGLGSSSATSNQTAVVQARAAPANTSPPTISGEPAEGEVLTANKGTWSGSEPIVYDYQWQRCDRYGNDCEPIAGAKADRYVVTPLDVNRTIRVTVRATNDVSSAESTSQQTAEVKPGLCRERTLDLADAISLTVAPCGVIPATGAIYHATVYSGDPAAGGQKLAEEWAQLGTYNARRVDPEAITTRGTVLPCAASPFTGCGEVRYRTRAGESNPTAADDYAVTRGTSPDDPRLDTVAAIQEPSSVELGPPAATGPLAGALEPWQAAPVGATSYALYEERSQQWVDGEPVEVVERLWIDPQTELPLKESRTVGEQVEAQTFYTYKLVDPTTAPPDLFLVQPPAKVDKQSVEDLALKPPLPDLAGQLALPTDIELFQQSLRFRKEFGLPTDPALIQRTLDDPSLAPAIDEWSVPLTPSEQKEMAIRDQVVANLPRIDAYAAQNAPASYAGAWIDQQAGGIAKVGFTQNVQGHIDAIKAFFPYPDRVQGFQADLTQDQLKALQDRIWADVDLLTAQGIAVREVALNVADNLIDVGVPVPNPVDEQRLRDRYGPNVRVVQSAPVPAKKKKKKKKKDDDKPPPEHSSPARGGSHVQSSRVERNTRTERNVRVEQDVPPLYGGLHITSGDAACTSGFTIYQDQGSERSYRILTAGHCGEEGSEWRHKGEPFGRMLRNLRREQGTSDVRSDAATIGIRDRFRSSQVMLGPGHFRRIDGFATVAEQWQGMPVCLAGATHEPYRCGTLRSPRAHVVLNGGNRLHDQGKTGGWDAAGGDSGGPVFAGHDALGLQSATNEGTADPDDSADYFTQIQYALNDLGQGGKPPGRLFISQNRPSFGYHDRFPEWVPAEPWDPNNPPPLGTDSTPLVKAFDQGVTTNRFAIVWDHYQASNGDVCLPLDTVPAGSSAEFWRNRYRQAYERMVRRGVRPILVLLGAPRCYSKKTRCVPDDVAAPPDPPTVTGGVVDNSADRAWKAFVAEIAEKFGKARGLEIWNEPNSPGFWGGCGDDPGEPPPDSTRYAELLQKARNAVKESENPNMPVVSAGLVPGKATGVKPWGEYLREVLGRAGAYVDAIGLHPYRRQGEFGNVDPNKNLDFAASAFDQLMDARGERNAVGLNKPIWVMEGGGIGDLSKASPSPPADKLHKFATDPNEQARKLVDVYRQLRDHGVPVIAFYKFVDGGGSTTDDPGWNNTNGVLNNDLNYTAKRAYCDLASEWGYSPCGP